MQIEQGQFINFQFFNFDLKETKDLVFFNSSDSVFHNLGPIKEKDSIPIFTLFAFGMDITFFSSVIVPFSVSVIVKWDLVWYRQVDSCIKSQMNGGESLLLILNISIAKHLRFRWCMVTEESLSRRASKLEVYLNIRN